MEGTIIKSRIRIPTVRNVQLMVCILPVSRLFSRTLRRHPDCYCPPTKGNIFTVKGKRSYRVGKVEGFYLAGPAVATTIRRDRREVVAALEATLLNNLREDGFTLKLGGFGKFSVRHKPGILRKIPFTGETILTKDRRKISFVSLGTLPQYERVIDKN